MGAITKETHTYEQILADVEKDYAVSVIFAQQAGATADVERGTVLGKITASGKYVEYDDDGTDDGRRVATGILKTAIKKEDLIAGDVTVAMYIRGVFVKDKLTGWDSAGQADLNANDIEDIISF